MTVEIVEKTENTEQTPAKPIDTATTSTNSRFSREDIQSMSLVERLLHIEEDMPEIPKTGHNEKGEYHFREAEQVVRAVRLLQNYYHVKVIPNVTDHKLHNKQGYSDKAGTEVARGVKAIVHMSFQFVNVDSPEDILNINWTAEGDDWGDKGTNKATTIAQKNMYLKLYNIGDEDPDAEVPEGGSIAAPSKLITSQKETNLYRMIRRLGMTVEEYEKALKKTVAKMTNEEADSAIAKFQAAIERQLSSESEVS